MFHNYYLYNNDGIFEWISWDLNMLFNGFPGSGLSDEEATQFLIDEPVLGSMESYPLIQAIFKNEDYVEKYHDYLTILSEGYLEEETFNAKVLSVYDMIKSYVETDPTSFYTYEQFENGLFGEDTTELGLLSFVNNRVANVTQQLSGEIESTNNDEGNTGSSTSSGMGGQLPDGDMQQALPDGDMQQALPDGDMQQAPPTEGMQQAPPTDATGQLPDGDESTVRPDKTEGQVPSGDTQQLPISEISVQQTSTDTSETSTTDIIVLLCLTGILTAMGIYLKRKH
jgi:hypothetical protein